MFAYIPARGGSKRIPRKNIKELAGKPLIVHVIENLLEVRGLSGIAVSSDDAEILETAARFRNITTLAPRSPWLADDKTGLMDLLTDDVPRFANVFSDEDVLICLPTAVLVEPAHYTEAIRQFERHPEGLVMSVTEYSISPFLALTGDPADLSAFSPGSYEKPTSDLPKAFADAGCFYGLRLSAAKGRRMFLELDPVQGTVLPGTVGIDLDTPADWERLCELYHKKESRMT